MKTTGRVNEILKEVDIEWAIPDFDTLSDEVDKCYSSPPFSFNDASWYLKIYPNGREADYSVGYIGICLQRLSKGPPTSLEVTIGIKALDGKRDRERHHTCICDDMGSRYVPRNFISQYGTPCGISRSQLFERKSELMPFNVLTMLCTLKNPKLIEDSDYIATAECIHCHILLNAVRISSHEERCASKPMKCPRCYDVCTLQNWYNHECKESRTKVLKVLLLIVIVAFTFLYCWWPFLPYSKISNESWRDWNFMDTLYLWKQNKKMIHDEN